LTFKRYLPSDVTNDIHDIIAKALYRRAMTIGEVTISPAELQQAAETEFEYDLLPDGGLMFRPVAN
jgi:hypothetical protein